MEPLWIGKSTEERLAFLLDLVDRNAENTLKIVGRLERLEKTTEILYAAASAADSIKILERKVEDISSFVVVATEGLAKIINDISTRLENIEKTVGQLKTDIAGIDRELYQRT